LRIKPPEKDRTAAPDFGAAGRRVAANIESIGKTRNNAWRHSGSAFRQAITGTGH